MAVIVSAMGPLVAADARDVRVATHRPAILQRGARALAGLEFAPKHVGLHAALRKFARRARRAHSDGDLNDAEARVYAGEVSETRGEGGRRLLMRRGREPPKPKPPPLTATHQRQRQLDGDNPMP